MTYFCDSQKRVDPNKVTAEKVDTEMSEKTAEQSIATEVEENGDRIESDDGMETLETEEVMIKLIQIFVFDPILHNQVICQCLYGRQGPVIHSYSFLCLNLTLLFLLAHRWSVEMMKYHQKEKTRLHLPSRMGNKLPET